jgi:hypothetical protein
MAVAHVTHEVAHITGFHLDEAHRTPARGGSGARQTWPEVIRIYSVGNGNYKLVGPGPGARLGDSNKTASLLLDWVQRLAWTARGPRRP